MSPLLATCTFVVEALIDASPAAVLAVLDDPPAYMRLNPLVIAVESAPGGSDMYFVTDRLPVLGLALKLRYRVRYTRVAEGFDADAWAALATRLHNELRVEPHGAGASVRETVRMTAPRPLLAYARATAEDSHRDLLDRLKRRCEGR